MMRNHRGKSIPNHQPAPAMYREKLPFGIHGQALEAGKKVLDRIPVAEKNFKKLQMRNNPLAMLVLSRVHREYNKTRHYRAPPSDATKRERYHKLAAKDVTTLIGRGFIADRVINEMKIDNINPNFVDAILAKKVLRVSEAKNLAKKITVLENIDRRRARETKSRLQSMLFAPLSYVEEKQKITPYRKASEFIDRQILIARNES